MTAAPFWSSPARPAPQPAPSTRSAGVDPNVVTATLLVALVAAVVLREPISEAIGTASSPAASAVAQQLPPLVELGPFVDMPRDIPAPRSPALHPPHDPFEPPSHAQARAGGAKERLPSSHSYQVRSGDSLWSITRREVGAGASTAAVTQGWRQLFADNRDRVGADPSNLRVGVILDIAGVRR